MLSLVNLKVTEVEKCQTFTVDSVFNIDIFRFIQIRAQRIAMRSEDSHGLESQE